MVCPEGPGHINTAVPKTNRPHQRVRQKNIVVEVKIPLRQAGNMVNVRLDITRVKSGQIGRGHQVAMVNDLYTIRVTQPVGGLRIRDDVNLPVLGEIVLKRTQAVAQLFVVAKPALNIAVKRQGVHLVGA